MDHISSLLKGAEGLYAAANRHSIRNKLINALSNKNSNAINKLGNEGLDSLSGISLEELDKEILPRDIYGRPVLLKLLDELKSATLNGQQDERLECIATLEAYAIFIFKGLSKFPQHNHEKIIDSLVKELHNTLLGPKDIPEFYCKTMFFQIPWQTLPKNDQERLIDQLTQIPNDVQEAFLDAWSQGNASQLVGYLSNTHQLLTRMSVAPDKFTDCIQNLTSLAEKKSYAAPGAPREKRAFIEKTLLETMEAIPPLDLYQLTLTLFPKQGG
jgi:hypothetical protein